MVSHVRETGPSVYNALKPGEENMKSRRYAHLALAAVLALMLIGVARADVIGSIWINNPNTGNAIPANVPGTTPDVTFTAPTPLDFSAGDGYANPYTIGGFLSSGGATVLTGSSLLGNDLNNTMFNFTGTVTVTNGQDFTVTHDDGLTLVIGGITVINQPGPTAPTTDTHTYTGPSGNLPFQLVYGECCGAPAVLQIDLPLKSVPDGGTTLMLLTGALAALETLRRRFRA